MSQGEAPVEILSASAAEAFIVRLLKERGPMSTMEIEKVGRDERKACPDQTVLFLTKMKRKGLIKGEVSLEKRGWLWWAE